MAERLWTEEQKAVIDSRACNLLVSAAAGAGKTAVLVQRIIELITDPVKPVDIDSLLVMTFTNAAAAEMKERVGLALAEAIDRSDAPEQLIRQQCLLHNAQITTIHSFCLGIIRDYFQLIELDPSFRIADETELKLLQADTLTEVLEKSYEAAEEAFIEFTESYGDSRSDKRIEEAVLELSEYAASYPWPEEWLQGLLEEFNIASDREFCDKRYMKYLMDHIQKLLTNALVYNAEAIECCSRPYGPEAYRQVLLNERTYLNELKQAKNYNGLAEILENGGFGRIPGRLGQDVDEELKNYVKTKRDKYKGIVADIEKDFFFQNATEMLQDINGAGVSMKALIKLVLCFNSAYAAKKAERNIIDFSDIEHFALNILIKHDNSSKEESQYTQAAYELRGRYSGIMIDEYQDSNFLQEEIAKAISGSEDKEPYVFMVGDVKQSIYKFRMARPELFNEKYKRYGFGEAYNRLINLHKNFRSRSEVLNCVNDVFSHMMTPSVGSIDYDEAARLNYGASYCDNPEDSKCYKAELLIVRLDMKETGDEAAGNETKGVETSEAETEREESVRVLEARVAAAKIKELVSANGCMVDDRRGGLRHADYGDIVILLRTMAGWSEVYTEVFAESGIPVFSDVQSGFFGTLEIRTVIDYLRILDNPRQDIPFAAVLHSPIGRLSSEELAQVRITTTPGLMLCEAVQQYAEEGSNEELRRKTADFITVYRRLKEQKYGNKITRLLTSIYEETGYYSYVSCMPGGDRRRGNLDMLLSQAAAYAGTSYTGLFSFIRYIERMRKLNIDYGEASLYEGGNAVRIMSIHKSKGLEFPIVILGGMGKQFNQTDAKAKIVFHSDYGIGPEFVDYRNRTKIPTLIKKVLQRAIQADNLEEEMRVLYVAMTRAKEKLIMLGTIRDYKSALIKWSDNVLGDSNAEYVDGATGIKVQEAGDEASERVMTYSYFVKLKNYFDMVYPIAVLYPDDFEICIQNGLEAGALNAEASENLTRTDETEADEPEEAWISELLRCRSFKYPYANENELPFKLSVSELKRLSMIDEFGTDIFEHEQSKECTIPRFMGGEAERTGTDRGTLYHKVMQFTDFTISDVKGVLTLLDNLCRQGIMTKAESELINTEKLLRFSKSSIAERLGRAQRAGCLRREQPFVIGIPAEKLRAEYKGRTDSVLVQGIIDAFFEEEGKIIVLDYKTDIVSSADMLIKRYKAQLDSYAEAIESLTGMSVGEKLIYSFCLSEVIEL